MESGCGPALGEKVLSCNARQPIAENFAGFGYVVRQRERCWWAREIGKIRMVCNFAEDEDGHVSLL